MRAQGGRLKSRIDQHEPAPSATDLARDALTYDAGFSAASTRSTCSRSSAGRGRGGGRSRGPTAARASASCRRSTMRTDSSRAGRVAPGGSVSVQTSTVCI